MFLEAAPHMYVLSGGMYGILTFAFMKTMLYFYSLLPVSVNKSTLTTVSCYFSG